MTWSKARFLISSIVLVLIVRLTVVMETLPQVKPEEVGVSSERLEQLSDFLQAYVDDGKLPGVVTLISRRGKVAYFEAFGWRDRELASRMQKDAIYQIASQTKAVASVGVMALQEEGRLLIFDPVGKYLPVFQKTTVAVSKQGGGYDVVKADRPITIRDLLTHTAGISYGNGVARERWKEAGIQGWYFANRNEPVGATVSRLASLPFDAQPGDRWVYEYNTDILGALIERVSGEALDEFL